MINNFILFIQQKLFDRDHATIDRKGKEMRESTTIKQCIRLDKLIQFIDKRNIKNL